MPCGCTYLGLLINTKNKHFVRTIWGTFLPSWLSNGKNCRKWIKKLGRTAPRKKVNLYLPQNMRLDFLILFVFVFFVNVSHKILRPHFWIMFFFSFSDTKWNVILYINLVHLIDVYTLKDIFLLQESILYLFTECEKQTNTLFHCLKLIYRTQS
jgi:hypothetical protein